jgi:mono/diheme cytochrome c family protein
VRAASVAGVFATLALAGCGGGASSDPPHKHIQLTPFEAKGRALFITTCGGCHTLADADTSGTAGPAFTTPWPAARVEKTIAHGIGLMQGGLVTGEAAAQVAAYVAAATK